MRWGALDCGGVCQAADGAVREMILVRPARSRQAGWSSGCSHNPIPSQTTGKVMHVVLAHPNTPAMSGEMLASGDAQLACSGLQQHALQQWRKGRANVRKAVTHGNQDGHCKWCESKQGTLTVTLRVSRAGKHLIYSQSSSKLDCATRPCYSPCRCWRVQPIIGCNPSLPLSANQLPDCQDR